MLRGAGLFQPVTSWSLLVALGYYLALALAIGARHWPLCQWVCGALMATCIACSCTQRTPVAPVLLYCQGNDGGAPALCLLSARGDGVVVIYPGSRASAYGLADALANEGIATIDWLLIPPGSRDRQGAMAIAKLMTVRAAVVIPPSRQQSATTRTMAALRARGVNTSMLAGEAGRFAVTWADGARLDYRKDGPTNEFGVRFEHAAMDFVLDYSRSRYGLSQLRWSAPDQRGSHTMRPALQPQCRRVSVSSASG